LSAQRYEVFDILADLFFGAVVSDGLDHLIGG